MSAATDSNVCIRAGDAVDRLRASGATVRFDEFALVASMGRGSKPLVRSFAYCDRIGSLVNRDLVELACDKFRAKGRGLHR